MQVSLKFRFDCCLLLAGALLTAAVAAAQVAGGGSIQGTVTDSSGAVVVGAQVTATNTATGVATVRTTTSAGLYVITPLPAAVYSVKVTASGFETFLQQNVTVDALATVSLPVQLTVGSSTQEVTVTSSPTMLHTDDATLGGNMENNVYTSLPLAMNGVPRDATQFVALLAGVSGMTTQVAGPTTESFNGTRGDNEMYVEGVPLEFPSQQADTRNIALGVSVEAVDQFQAETNGEKAMYSGQGMMNFVLKSGTNQFHGAAYEYFRNTDLDSRGFFPATLPSNIRMSSAARSADPIKKDKVFFFGSYAGYCYKTAETPEFETIPTLAERTGNFSSLPTTIYDPQTQTCNGAICSNQPFPGNTIPANRFSTVSKSFASYLPNPPTGTSPLITWRSLPEGLHNNNTTDKVDLNQSSQGSVLLVYSQGRYVRTEPGAWRPRRTPCPCRTRRAAIVQENTTIGQIHYPRVISLDPVQRLRVRLFAQLHPAHQRYPGGRYPQKAGLTGRARRQRPGQRQRCLPDHQLRRHERGERVGGHQRRGVQPDPERVHHDDNVLWVHGKHAIAFGFTLQRPRIIT